MKLRTEGAFVLALLCIVSAGSFTYTYAQEASPTPAPTPDVNAKAAAPAPAAPAAAPAAKVETPAVLVDDKHVESILGKSILSSSGETLGNVTDILVDGDGHVRAAIVDFGGFLGVGVRKLAVAWSALHFVQGKSAITAVLDMNKDQLRGAPEYRAGDPIVIVGAAPKPSGPSSPDQKK
ncbi:MAG: PRC-barrel domain-containing protein [Proteobacteria bacterium]|nr:PRC-barrel domain-containing protein [Pseudomonadota bacterium]